MEVIHTYQANLATSLNEPVLHAMQHDGARKITVQLYTGPAVWAVPEGVTAGIGYTLPNRQSEYYEKLSDGTAACTIEGNTVTAVLAPVLTSVTGDVKVSIIFAKNGVQLSTFPFRIRVTARPGQVDHATRPDVSSPFAGKLYYGGDKGIAIPLTLGAGVQVEQQVDGTFILTAEGAAQPLLLNADDTYENDSRYGDKALEAIKTGRQILVRVKNASGENYVANYSPVYMYQVPNQQNDYLYLFFLKDEKQDLSALVGMPAGTVLMPTYGQLKMKLSQYYNSNPLDSLRSDNSDNNA